MFSGMALQAQGNMKGAADQYEKLLAINKKFAPAANNLAWILADQGKEMDRALELARTAHDAAPNDPSVADTLGWIYYKRGSYDSALPLLTDSAAKLTENPEVLLHLGMTQQKLGKTEEARVSLEKALKINPNVAGAEEARQALGSR
jgi:tetratricopeptide (TPR) repeat protein